jgi:hypothetical protein
VVVQRDAGVDKVKRRRRAHERGHVVNFVS